MTTANPDSILDSVKKTLGFDPDYQAFDLDITLFINGAFGSLQQLGVGGDTGFVIRDNTTLWAQYISSAYLLGLVKSYVYFFVRLSFDPPDGRFGLSAIQDQLHQLEWRINVAAEQIDPPSDPFASTALIETDTTMFYVVKKVNLTYAPTVAPDAKAGNNFNLSLTGDCTINAPVNGTDGEHVTLFLTSSGHAVTWGNGWNFGGSGAPVLSSDKTDVITAIYNETAAEWYAGFTPGF